MKKILLLAIVVFTIALCMNIFADEPRTICRCGYLYYDWNNRPFGMMIPVLENNDMIECEEQAEEQ